jgi:hypothetical protein
VNPEAKTLGVVGAFGALAGFEFTIVHATFLYPGKILEMTINWG